ncbi:MAG: hypothetical protein AB1916_05905, partial [Thermodesulfobacteriota bacterium]
EDVVAEEAPAEEAANGDELAEGPMEEAAPEQADELAAAPAAPEEQLGDELADAGPAPGEGADLAPEAFTQVAAPSFQDVLQAAGVGIGTDFGPDLGPAFNTDFGPDLAGDLGGDAFDILADALAGGLDDTVADTVADTVDDTVDDTLPPVDPAALLAGDDTAFGSPGDDYIAGYGGNDVLYGGAGNDWLDGGAGNDALWGGRGSDTLQGGAGSDLLHGGEGNSPVQRDNIDDVEDGVIYSDAASAMTVNLMTGITSGGDTDTLAYVEAVVGSGYNDSLYGNPYESNWFAGGAGNDTIVGHAGANTLYGVTPWYEASYFDATSGVSVNLATGIATGGGGTDSLAGITDVSGSAYDDTLVGDSSNHHNWFMGMGGNDSIVGTGVSIDEASYWEASGGVSVDLAAGRASGADGNDTLVSIENVEGSRYGDTLVGTSGNNRFDGGGGDDSIVGGAGVDTLDFDEVDAAVTVDLAAGWAVQDGDAISLSGIEAVEGSRHDDSILGDSSDNFLQGHDGDDTLEGRAGNDTLDGGSSYDPDEMDFASYAHASAAVTVDLQTGSSSGADGADSLVGIEGVIGSDHNDCLVGVSNSDLYQIFIGGLGNDTFVGNGGDVDVSYAGAAGAVTVTIAGTSGQATGAAGADSLYNVAMVTGSNYDDVFTGGSLSVYFNPRQGNDQVTGGSTAYDVVNYSSAPGSVTVDLAAGRAWGADGEDTLSSVEYAYGSQYNDTLLGDAGDNRLRGRRGDDSLDGRGGSDEADYKHSSISGVTVNLGAGQASGGAGNDILVSIENVRGSDYADTLIGCAGGNSLRGEGGDDWFRATAGNDTYYGGSGDDQVSYESMTGGVTVNLDAGWVSKPGGSDWLYEVEMVRGSEYADSMQAGPGWTALEGGAGNDILTGYAGGDSRASYRRAPGGVTVDLSTGRAYGAAGDDTLSHFVEAEGSAYADCLVGDAADNYLRGRGGNDTLVGGAGFDMASFRWADQGVRADLAAGAATGEGTDSLSGIEELEGSAYNDTLLGDAGDNFFRGRGGDDWIDGGGGMDRVSYRHAASGVLVVLASGSSYGEDGNDIIWNVENIEGSDYCDTLLGDAGSNDIRGRAGNDWLDGLAGDDTVSYKWASGGVTVDLTTGRATGADGSDTLVNFENILGSSYNDSLQGDGAPNRIFGLGGNDTMRGLAGADTLYGGDGSDSMDGGDGSDWLHGEAGDDSLQGWLGDDSLLGGDGNDSLYGYTENDRLEGGAGNDTLDGGDGNDWLHGEAGADSLYGGAGADWLVGGDGDDTLDGGPAGEGPDWVTYRNYAHGGMVIDLNPSPTFGTATDSLGGYTDKLVHIENVAGSQYADSIVGDGEHNTLQGWEGDDIIRGGGGNDVIHGGTGNDQIYGDFGDDTLYGGDGNDVIHGGDGASASAGFDRIIGGQGDDQLDAGIMNSNSVLDYSDLTSDGSGAGYQGVAGSISGTMTDPWGDTDTVSNFTRAIGTQFNDSIMGSANNDTIWGMAGNDTLSGGGGTDSLDGGDGGDTYFYTSSQFETTPANADRILSFSRAAGDRFLFDSSVNGLDADNDGIVDADKFFDIANYTGTGTPATSSPAMIWDSANDVLIYDSNGTASAGGVSTVAYVTTTDELVNTDLLVG